MNEKFLTPAGRRNQEHFLKLADGQLKDAEFWEEMAGNDETFYRMWQNRYENFIKLLNCAYDPERLLE